ncbi:hypothetical protein [Arthrobacter sp. StoSoilB5]|nr:hypothetical protein [Arthrobacter sp. StoSoilB5]
MTVNVDAIHTWSVTAGTVRWLSIGGVLSGEDRALFDELHLHSFES